MSKWIDARDACNKSIEENDGVVKAWFCQGKACLDLNNWELVIADFNKASTGSW